MGILIWIIFGAIIGWLAGLVMGDSKSLVMNIIVGILGALLGSWIASMLFDAPIDTFSVWGVVFSVIGAAILIAIKRALTGRGF